jgi:hypothetical protein
MESKSFEKLKNILMGSNLHGTEVNEVADLIDEVCEEYHQDKLKNDNPDDLDDIPCNRFSHRSF